MSALPGPWNPITYGQFHAGGGWRIAGAIVGAYVALVGGAIWFTATHDRHPDEMLEGWAHGLLVLQVLTLIGFGTFRVNGAIRSDVTGKMIESHRLMPTSPLSAVLGYVLGTPAVPVMVFLATLLMGAACVAGSSGRIAMDEWGRANLMIAASAVCVWAVVAQFAFAARGGFLLLLVAGGLAVASQGMLIFAVPALKVITAPLISRTVVELRSLPDDAEAFAAVLLLQLALTVVCGLAAIRRYRSAVVSGFSPLLGVALVGVWVAASLAALRRPDLFGESRYGRDQSVASDFTVSIAGALLLAAVPVASAARRTGNDGPIARRIAPLLFAIPLAALVVAVVSANNPRELPVVSFSVVPPAPAPTPVPTVTTTSSTGPGTTVITTNVHGPAMPFVPPTSANLTVTAIPHAAWVTILAATTWLAGTGGLFAWLAVRHRRAWAAFVLWLGITWVGPVLVDQTYQTVIQSLSNSPTWISTLSPIAIVAMVYEAPLSRESEPVRLTAGLVGQALIALVPITAAAILIRRRVRDEETSADHLGSTGS